MAFGWIAFVIVTALWAGVGGVAPFFVKKRDDKSLIQTMLVLTGVCGWLFWLCAYLAQINPLFGPVLNNSTLKLIMEKWN